MKNKRGLLLVISGPSGAGKGTVCKAIMEKYSDIFHLSVSATTRGARPGEVDGVNYHYLTMEEFKKRIENNEFIEWAEFCDNLYGTPKASVEKLLAEGKDVILEIEAQGGLKVREMFPEAIMFFVLPPSADELKNRLVGRGTEEEDVIEQRLKQAVWELSQTPHYDYVLLNDEVELAVQRFIDTVDAKRRTIERNGDFIDSFAEKLKEITVVC